MQNIITYIEDLRERDGGVDDIKARSRLHAADLIVSSNAYRLGSHKALGALAQDLINENTETIRVANKYPEIFHANIVVSRMEENEVYSQIIAMTADVSSQ